MKYSSKYGFLLPEDYEYYSIDHNNTNFGNKPKDIDKGIEELLSDTEEKVINTLNDKQYEKDFRELECNLTLGSDWKSDKNIFIDKSEWSDDVPKHGNKNNKNEFKSIKDLLNNEVTFNHVEDSEDYPIKSIVNSILEKPIIDLTLTDISNYIISLNEEYKNRFNGSSDVSFIDSDKSIKTELSQEKIYDNVSYFDFIYNTIENTYEWYENEIRNNENFKPLVEIDNIENALNILLNGKDVEERLDYLASNNIKYLFKYIDKSRLEKMVSRNYEGKLSLNWFRDYNTGLMYNFGDEIEPLKEITEIKKDDKGNITKITKPISVVSELSYIDDLINKITDTPRIIDEVSNNNLQGVFDSSTRFSTKTNMLYTYIQKTMNITRNDQSFDYDITINVDKLIFNDIYRRSNSIDNMVYEYKTTSNGKSAFTINLYKQTKIENIDDDISYLHLINYSDDSCNTIFNTGDVSIDQTNETIIINPNDEPCECIVDIIDILNSGDGFDFTNDTFDFAIEGCKLDNFIGSIYLKHKDDSEKNVILINDKSIDYLDGIINKNITLLDNISNYSSIVFDKCDGLKFNNIGIYLNIFSGTSGNLYTISAFDSIDLPISYDYSLWSKYIQKTNKYYISSINTLIVDNTFYNMEIVYKISDDIDNKSITDMVSRELPLYESNFAMYYKDNELSEKYGLNKEGYDYSITSNNDEIIQNGRIIGDTNAAITYINSANIYKSAFYKLYGIFNETVTKRVDRVIDNTKYFKNVSKYSTVDLETRNIDYNGYTLEIISNSSTLDDISTYKNRNEYKCYGTLPNGQKGWGYIIEYTHATTVWSNDAYWTIGIEQILFTEYGKVYYRYGSTLEFAAQKNNLTDKNKRYKKIPMLGDNSKDYATNGGVTQKSQLSRVSIPDDLRKYLSNRQIAWGYYYDYTSNTIKLNNYLKKDYDYKTDDVKNWFVELDDCMTLSEIFDYMPHRRDAKYEYNGKKYINQINTSHTNKFCDVESGWE